MVEVTVSGGPRVSFPEIHNTFLSMSAPERRYRIPALSEVPLIASYAFRQGSQYAVFVLSRALTLQTHVTLHLPASSLAATLYTLTGDPRATNLDAPRIKIRRRRISHHTGLLLFAASRLGISVYR